jgi:hypothetical protein
MYNRKAFFLYQIDFKNNVLPYFDVFQKHVKMVTFLYGEHNGPDETGIGAEAEALNSKRRAPNNQCRWMVL